MTEQRCGGVKLHLWRMCVWLFEGLLISCTQTQKRCTAGTEDKETRHSHHMPLLPFNRRPRLKKITFPNDHKGTSAIRKEEGKLNAKRLVHECKNASSRVSHCAPVI